MRTEGGEMVDQSEPAGPTALVLNRLIEAMSEAVLVVDQAGLVVAANQAAVDLFDLPSKAAALRPLAEYDELIRGWSVGGEQYAPAALLRALEGEAIPRQLATITTAAGIQRVVQFTAAPIHDEQGRVVLAMLIASDLTSQERVRAYWQAVGTAARGLSAELDLRHVLDTALDQLVEALGAQVVIGIWRLDEVERRLSLLTSRGVSPESAARLVSLGLDSPTLICEAARTRQVRYAEDTRKAPPPYDIDRHLIEAESLGSWVVAPLVVGERALGVMSYGLHSSHRFYEEDLLAITAVSGLFAEAIDHALLHEEIQDVNQRLIAAGVREQELADEAERARDEITSILERIADAFFALDHQWRFTYVNSRAEQLLRARRGELIGRRIWEAFPEAVGSAFQREYARALAEQVPVEFEGYYAPFETWFEVHAHPDRHGLTVYFQDVTERRRMEEALRESEERFRTLVDSMHDIVFTLDREQRHTGVFGRWMAEYGLTPEVFLGRTAREILGPSAASVHEEANRRVLAGEVRTYTYQWSTMHRGELRHFETTVSALQNHGGSAVLGIVGVGRDVTEHQRAEQFREEYVSIISHDLRNPLTTLQGYAQLLRRSLARKGMEREASAAEAIETGSRRMNAMIQELVDSTRLEAGRLEMHLEPVDLLRLVAEIVERIGSAADRARIDLERPGLLPLLRADPERLERAIVNLLTNALKYSPPESRVVLRVTASDREAVVSVVDQGVGIPPEDLPLLFQRYYRAKTGAASEGLGLGLYITRLIVEAHGGRIWCESAVGRGSAFSLALPLSGREGGGETNRGV